MYDVPSAAAWYLVHGTKKHKHEKANYTRINLGLEYITLCPNKKIHFTIQPFAGLFQSGVNGL
jgi:hypothetical protein